MSVIGFELTSSPRTHTLALMKATAPPLSEEDPVRIPIEDGGMLTDQEADAVHVARDCLESALASAPAGSVVPLSLEGIELSASCVAAVLGPVISKIVDQSFQARYVVGLDPSAKNRWDADAGLVKESHRTNQKLVCVWRTAEGVELLGDVDDQVRTTYAFVVDREGRGVTARDLADHENISIQAASNRLAKAHKLGVIHKATRRSVSGSGGSENVYIPVK